MYVVRHCDEKSLLISVAQGDEAAFEVLFNQYKNKILFFTRKFLRSESKAEDALQEIFLKVWTCRQQLPEIRNFKTWLNTITRNYLFNALRRLALEEAFIKELSTNPGDQRDIIGDLTANELQLALQSAVANLSPQQKRIFQLSRVEGLKHEQIAERLAISRETVKKHMTDALCRIRAQMKTHESLVHLSVLLLSVNL
ncbi:MAG: RNA polymerase sigma-70 factor [Bacteroidota bacterium]|nr:RNA polymerase sigma-70 factor [Bacteroidota bacterium]MDP4214917.1 RNA polymerase sigma-70 factor [Bacteroidota bacterium]MDP4246368.1 RNA polymerase sigma-70 factor [Bacteroidota bacterium]MDP4254697.1 RNA polymerase sigma-70 factor [Bacteroidota bacterium]MDP4258844.1 RNA polymerase sigma-70 factor [Bacteroidota bacterium]